MQNSASPTVERPANTAIEERLRKSGNPALRRVAESLDTRSENGAHAFSRQHHRHNRR
jgi:hypothetical protein